jgi:hypothetical protein
MPSSVGHANSVMMGRMNGQAITALELRHA